MVVSLIPELEDVVRYGTRAKRVDALQRITALFLDGAKSYSDAHVDVFDDIFGLLIEEIETKARAELSRPLAPVGNAPVKVLRTLANDDDIAVAGPVLKYAPRLGETDLVGVATAKSQAHLQAISARPALGVAVTDVLVRRGDREVVRCVADNRGARISQNGFVSLVRRAEDDGILMGYGYHRGRDEGQLVLLDAQTLESMATVHLPQRVPMGFHGNWAPAG